MRLACALAWSLPFAACATNFTGSAHIEGGRATCEGKCKEDGLTMTGLVYLGEYSSACVCSVPGSDGSRNNKVATASVAAGAAGVVLQARNMQAYGAAALLQ
jgi:hypothetical protein